MFTYVQTLHLFGLAYSQHACSLKGAEEQKSRYYDPCENGNYSDKLDTELALAAAVE